MKHTIALISVVLIFISGYSFCQDAASDTSDVESTADFKPLPAGKTLVTPPNESVLLGSQIGMIVRGKFDELYLDDEAIQFSKRIQTPTASFSLLKVSPGRHCVYMSSADGREEEFEFVIAINDKEHNGPQSWKRFYQHQFENISNPCGKCHQTRKVGDKVEVGYWKPVKESCATCHVEQKRLKLEGFHKDIKQADWIEKCTDCHYVHQGATRMLLRDNYKP